MIKFATSSRRNLQRPTPSPRPAPLCKGLQQPNGPCDTRDGGGGGGTRSLTPRGLRRDHEGKALCLPGARLTEVSKISDTLLTRGEDSGLNDRESHGGSRVPCENCRTRVIPGITSPVIAFPVNLRVRVLFFYIVSVISPFRCFFFRVQVSFSYRKSTQSAMISRIKRINNNLANKQEGERGVLCNGRNAFSFRLFHTSNLIKIILYLVMSISNKRTRGHCARGATVRNLFPETRRARNDRT